MDCWIVTGGAGFIGCNFVRLALAETTSRVVVLDKLTYAGHLENLEEVRDHPRYEFIHGDIADRDLVRDIFRKHQPTAILNFAAESHVDRSIDDPGVFVHTNVIGTHELLEAARQHLKDQPQEERQRFRFLHVSTDEVYGSLGASGLFSETTPYAPNSPYAASKAAADFLVRAYQKTYDLPTLITNCSNNFGPYQFPEKLIPLMLLNAAEAKPLPIYGDGLNVRDWLYVEDHCRGILEVLQRGQPGEKYNIGGLSERTNLEVVDTICEVLEERLPAAANSALDSRGLSAYHELKSFVPDRPGHDLRYAIDSTKVRQELGWEPRYEFADALRQTVAWYLDHRDWCAAVQNRGSGRERLGLG
jgi:dTDP-glucose 4,6-dehydratase